MAHLMDNSGINYNEDYDLTNHGASLDKDELDRLLHCPECGEMMGPGGKPLTFSDAHMQWAHKACWEDAQQHKHEWSNSNRGKVCMDADCGQKQQWISGGWQNVAQWIESGTS